MTIYKDYLYQKIKEEAENKYIQDYLDDYDADIEECIEEAIRNNFEELLDDEEYDDYDEDDLAEIFFDELNSDINIDELEESVDPTANLWDSQAE